MPAWGNFHYICWTRISYPYLSIKIQVSCNTFTCLLSSTILSKTKNWKRGDPYPSPCNIGGGSSPCLVNVHACIVYTFM